MLAREQFTRGPDGTQVSHPIPLAEAADLWQRVIATGRGTEDKLRYSSDELAEGSPDLVAFSSARAEVIASLLDELALRTQPGRSSGPIRSSDSLSELAKEIARYLRSLA